MTSRRAFIAGLCAASLTRPALAALPPGEVLVGLPNNVFANLHNGRPTGIMVEAIGLILGGMGKIPVFIVMSNAEMSGALQEGLLGLNTVTVLTPGNKDLGLYTDPIVSEFNMVAIRADQTVSVKRLGDLHGLHLGGRQGYLYPLLEADPEIHIERFQQDGELIRNLIHGKIDAAIISALSDVYKLRAEGVMSRIRVLDHAVGEVPLRAVLSRRVFSEADLAEFNRRLAELRAGPVWKDILERNGFADLAVDWPMVAR